MAKSAGRLMTASYNSSGSTYLTLGQSRTKSITLNLSPIDVTNSDSSNWTELFDAEGVKNVSVTFGGLVDTDAGDATEANLNALYIAGTIKAWKIVIDQIGEFAGSFQITSLDYSGSHNDAVAYTIALASSGAITFTAA